MLGRVSSVKVKQNEKTLWVELETEKEMRVYMHPLRQRILDLLERTPQGMSAKKVADALQIAPSSAGHHLRALQDICLVKEARTEKIHGFEAKIYEATHASVHITPKGMSLTLGERTAFLNHEISARSERFLQAVEDAFQENPFTEIVAQKSPHLSGGICYCTKEEMEELTQMMVRFFESRTQPTDGANRYEYCFFQFPVSGGEPEGKEK